VSDIQSPVGPQGTLAYRAAKVAVIVLTALIILALIGLVVGSVMKLSGRSTKLTGGGASQTLALPQGARIVSSESQPGRLILHVRSPAGDEIDIVNTDDGKLVGRVVAAPPPPPARQ
jgi:ribosomal protein L2